MTEQKQTPSAVKAALADRTKLVEFFRNEGHGMGWQGDEYGWTPAETAIKAMKELQRLAPHPCLPQLDAPIAKPCGLCLGLGCRMCNGTGRYEPPALGLVERLRNGGQPDLADMAQALVTALDEQVSALRASHAELREALTRLCTQFPTDSDMANAGWEAAAINEACNAYDAARAALANAPE